MVVRIGMGREGAQAGQLSGRWCHIVVGFAVVKRTLVCGQGDEK